MSLTYIGVDPSLTGTGLAAVVDGKVVDTFTLSNAKLDGVSRLIWLRDQTLAFVKAFAKETGVDGICVEGYSFGSRATQAHKTGEWGGVLRVSLIEAGHRLYLCPPSSLKKFATGKGNTPGKAPMALALYKLTGLDLAAFEDEVDASLLGLALDAKLNPDRRKYAQAQTDGLKGIEQIVTQRTRPKRGA